MAEFPAFPLFTDAYLGDTTHLTTFEHGAYLLLLIVSWRSKDGKLPDNDAMLARYTRTNLDKWRRLRPILAPFFQIRGGFWSQARLQDELQHLRSRKAQQSEAGRASVLSKSLKRSNRQSTHVVLPLQRNSNETSTPTPTPTPTKDSVAKATDTDVSIDPEKVMFDGGIAYLAKYAIPERKARSLIGQWKRDSGGAAHVIAAISAAQREGSIEPVSFITACLKRRNIDAKQSSNDTYRDPILADAFADLASRMDQSA